MCIFKVIFELTHFLLVFPAKVFELEEREGFDGKFIVFVN